MGTNYYVYVDRCGECGRGERMHLGKSSIGWKFCWRAYPERNLTTFGRWKEFLQGNQDNVEIVDEYDKPLSVTQMLEYVERKNAAPWSTQSNPDDIIDAEGHRLYDGEFS